MYKTNLVRIMLLLTFNVAVFSSAAETDLLESGLDIAKVDTLSVDPNYIDRTNISYLRSMGKYTYLATTISPNQSVTCNYWGDYYRFDHTSKEGRVLFDMLLSSKLANKSMSVWFSSSSAPGTTEQTGCTSDHMAQAIGFRIW